MLIVGHLNDKLYYHTFVQHIRHCNPVKMIIYQLLLEHFYNS